MQGDMGQSTGAATYDSSDKSKEKNMDQKVCFLECSSRYPVWYGGC